MVPAQKHTEVTCDISHCKADIKTNRVMLGFCVGWF